MMMKKYRGHGQTLTCKMRQHGGISRHSLKLSIASLWAGVEVYLPLP